MLNEVLNISIKKRKEIETKNLPLPSEYVQWPAMLFDLHIHTTLSSCSQLHVEDAITRAKARGLDGICITDHNTMGVRHLLSEGLQDNGLCVIFGMEYCTAQGDFLLFGPFETLQPHLPADLLLHIVDQCGGVAVAAHPFRKGRSLDRRIIDEGRCCAIESLNGRNTPSENMAVEQWRQHFDLTECGGSDAHSIEEVATYATRFFGPVRTRFDLIHLLKNHLCGAEELCAGKK
jgi:predicted metal-dependent phosphoesterase TrpH